MAISEPARTQEMHTDQMSPPGSNGVPNRYALTDRERRRRHWWWAGALLVAIVVALITFALARNRGDQELSVAVALAPAVANASVR